MLLKFIAYHHKQAQGFYALKQHINGYTNPRSQAQSVNGQVLN